MLYLHVSDNKKLRQKNDTNARFLPRYVGFEFTIFSPTRKDLYWVEFAEKSSTEVLTKSKKCSRTSESQTNDIIHSNRSNTSSRVLGKRITCAVTHCASYSGNMDNRWHKKQLVLQQGWLKIHTLFKHFQKNWLHSLKCIHRSYLHFIDKNLKYISKTFGLG